MFNVKLRFSFQQCKFFLTLTTDGSDIASHIQEHILYVTELSVIATSFGELALQTSPRGSNMMPGVCHHN